MKRIFIGSFIEDDTLKKNYSLIKREFGGCLKGRWTPFENLHITFKFLGDTQEEKIDLIKQSLSSILDKDQDIHIVFKGFGVFPNINRPRVFFLKVENPDKKLNQLNEFIQEKLEYLGYKRDLKEFIPHITLKRPRFTNVDQLILKMNNFQETVFGEVFKIKVNVIQSILSPDGAKYIKI
jgi:2'-5' RNA ligase